ncbi:17910_t:CDS:2 [Funneliformis geosporum]|uniref:7051_t:CDS:1 n=1 Tax=Funneliformis geosporum TaxID=1117311 RepID=A0A9W4WTA4_9GLOM|nr:7051_t:CDS:2 [Funneliformis geosporum]CAI2174429.1 17910_t:CDS:2 [Funneliformis geosporum]
MSNSKTKKLTDQEITAQFNAMKTELQSIAQKIGELESESDEHKAVIDTLSPLNDDRKCFRLVNGVLLERTVKDVLPALQTNYDGIKGIMDNLVRSYKTKEDEFIAFQKEHNIKPVISIILDLDLSANSLAVLAVTIIGRI